LSAGLPKEAVVEGIGLVADKVSELEYVSVSKIYYVALEYEPAQMHKLFTNPAKMVGYEKCSLFVRRRDAPGIMATLGWNATPFNSNNQVEKYR